MTTPRIYWAQGQQDIAAGEPRIYWAQGSQDAMALAQPRIYWAQINGAPIEQVPADVSSVDAFALTGATYSVTWVDNSNNETGFEVQLEVPSLSGNWLAATGSDNPTVAGVQAFTGNGATASTPYRVRVRSRGPTLTGDWVVSGEFTTDNPGGGGGELVGPNVAIAFQEPADDTVSLSATLRQSRQASVALREDADDTVVVSATVRRALQAALGFIEPADDTVIILGDAARSLLVALAYVEEEDDTVAVRGVMASGVVVSGTLAGLAAEYVTLRAASGLFIAYEQVLACAIKATRFYAGWATLEDPTFTGDVFTITGTTRVTVGEWALIAPGFHLYCERESAVVVEASRVMGVELVGRSTSEVAAEIQQYEMELPQRAYQEDAWSVGLPPPVV